MFEPFYRSDAARTASGVGIGLAVCKRLMEASHGRAWMEARPGGGLIAAFALRLVEPSEFP